MRYIALGALVIAAILLIFFIVHSDIELDSMEDKKKDNGDSNGSSH